MFKKALTIFACIMLIFTSCSSKHAYDDKEPDYTPFLTDNSYSTYGDNQGDNTTSNSKDNKTTINKTDEDATEVWPLDINFTGITSKESYPTGNLNTNYKFVAWPSAMVCPDNKNNTVYFVNYGKDNYIYQIKDGISTILIEKKAHSLQLWEDKLYFISYESSNTYQGDIYSYDLITKRLEVIQKGPADLLYIDNSGIFYYKFDVNGYFNGYVLTIEEAKSTKVDYILPISYNEFQIHGSNDGIYLKEDNNESLLLAPLEYASNKLNVQNEHLIFVDSSHIYTMNLTNAETKVICLEEYKVAYIYDYVVIKDTIYISDGGSIFTIPLVGGDLKRYAVVSENINERYDINNLYSDGRNLYGITSDFNNNNKMVAITLTKNKNNISQIQIPYVVEVKELIK